jgi:hypothetical protein
MTQQSPYEAPNAQVEDKAEQINMRFRWVAVIVGAAADLASTTLTGMVLVMALFIGSRYGSVEEMMEHSMRDWSFLMTSLLVGSACTVFGGYVAARMARGAFLQHALAAGLLSLAAGILIFPPDDSPYSGIMSLLGYGLHLPFAALGGWYVARRASVRGG